jgi:glutathione synthase/RimK-type ligase-like ATP-grasp enzyme
VLIAASQNWTGAARLPSTLGPAGITVDLMDRGRVQAASSRWVATRTVVKGSMDRFVGRVLDAASGYDRVIPCDEPLIMALLASRDARAAGVLPGPPELLSGMLDKTRFPVLAAAAGIRVARSEVVANEAGLVGALARVGLPAVLKGREGFAGMAVRRVADPADARAAASELGYPLLVEQLVVGESCLMPCLFERGTLVAAIGVTRSKMVREFGPSTVNDLRAVDGGMRRTAEAAGRGFALHGFASIDFLDPGDGSDPVVLEINPRPVPQLHLGARLGADMAMALREQLEGVGDGVPRLGRAGGRVTLFPQELHRLKREHGSLAGTLRWAVSRGALRDVPLNDLRLVRRHLRRSD